MAFNVLGSSQVPLSVFGGKVSEMAPADLPEGVSPDCQDVVFAPGSVASRPALEKVFNAPLPKGAAPFVGTVVYGKTYLSPAGGIENLYLDSNGNLWWEDAKNNPGNYVQIGSVTPGSWAKSVTAFGREYIAISDGQHGNDPALQWDGTNLDRVTQDGPGVAPTVANLALPAVNMAVAGAGTVLAVAFIETTDEDPEFGFFSTIVVTVAAGASVLVPGVSSVAIAGNAYAGFNATFGVSQVNSDTEFICAAYFSAYHIGAGGTATFTGGGTTATRAANVVKIKTAAPHNLQPGYRVQIAGLPAAAVGGGVASIVINNQDSPGLATITTNAAHGLAPNSFITLTGVTPVVGPNIASISRQGGIVTVVTSTPHNLLPGASFTIDGATNTTFNTSSTVLSVISPTGFTFLQGDGDAVEAPSAGHINKNWPIPATATPQYFQVLTAPTATTFQVELHYGDGTWNSGVVSFAWNGKFYVQTVPDATTLTYEQYGPSATTTTVGTVTPYGQIAPGEHQVRVSFLTRNGQITKPGPFVKFTAPGGQYASLTNIPIGPPNVVGRILQFTGAQGAFFFYIPVPAQVNGQIVSTATQINDNVTTAAVLDFSDNTLFAAIGVSQAGNDLASQTVLDGCLGFGFFASRLFAYGQRNPIVNLWNMGFDGGYLPSAPTVPSGWTGTAGALVAGHFGVVWQAASGVSISQPCYQDCYGAPILTGNTKYRFRCWAKAVAGNPTVTATISSAATGFSSTVTLPVSTVFGSLWIEGAFNNATPDAIPPDAILTIAIGGGGSAQLDDLSILYSEAPYSRSGLFSYFDNPEAFDGVTGVAGPVDDTHPILEAVVLSGALYLLTQEPGGRIHKLANNGTTEPAFWPVNQIGANCGVLSAFGTSKSQADDSTASGGEEWFAWASASGARIFGGEQPWKVSQEIEPDWRGAAAAGALQWSAEQGINLAAQFSVWAVNDPQARRVYFGLPIGAATAPSRIYVMDYRELDTAYQIGNSPPVHTSYTGRLVATDHTRKWAPWNRAMNGAALMCRSAGKLALVLFAGNGQTPGAADGFANVYTLNPAKYTDDDYGQIYPQYATYFFVTHDLEQALQLGAVRKTVTYLTAFAAGLGNLSITPLCNALSNAWSITGLRALTAAPISDLEWPGGNASGQRIAFRFASVPVIGTDNWFNLQRMVVAMRPAAHLPVRGTV